MKDDNLTVEEAAVIYSALIIFAVCIVAVLVGMA